MDNFFSSRYIICHQIRIMRTICLQIINDGTVMKNIIAIRTVWYAGIITCRCIKIIKKTHFLLAFYRSIQ
jgi:hypothetical protein